MLKSVNIQELVGAFSLGSTVNYCRIPVEDKVPRSTATRSAMYAQCYRSKGMPLVT